ncbi:hypothetical protein IW140_005666 [Coemansia sp. RSA 1813]|nr:hypothetical protein EV178_005238 [Coemansia sp. RSA 1646]KAJ1767763.1 hypothetical protein LPJ74_005191 [Coemansia sp. RSA 1843]KAJ2087071.1 hypothetical protein IW138_005228 [Coemansia sp. RSA 986]KAJ2212793.1 hypothetical protein EV179_004360 [Coemansia sp. RSA 487]KAJ2564641.1 hypothetical protein IW140_005666 [Coemansia sp. RSA 1813]
MTRFITAPFIILFVACLALGFDVNLLWDVPDDARDITQASAHVQLNSTTAPIGTEWIGVGWETGAISVQKLSNEQLVVLMQVRAPNNDSTVRAGRVTEYASAHYIDRSDKQSKQGMYLQAKLDQDDSKSPSYTLKVIAHYNMVANNTIYQGLWSDGEVWTYMGSLVLQHPKTTSIKEEVARALEEAAQIGDGHDSKARAVVSSSSEEPSTEVAKDPLGGARPPETLATCAINRDTSSGLIKPVCKFVRQLPMVPSFATPYSGIRRTADGNRKFERAGIFKDLALKGRLANMYEVAAGRCVSHNRDKTDIASCQRDPNNPEFFIAMDGLTPVEARERAELLDTHDAKDPEEDPDVRDERSKMHHEASKLPDIHAA